MLNSCRTLGSLCLLAVALLAGCSTSAPPTDMRSLDWPEARPPSSKTTPARVEARAPLPAPVPKSQDRPAEMWIALDRWCKANSLPLPARVEASADSGYQLNTPKGNLYLRAG